MDERHCVSPSVTCAFRTPGISDLQHIGWMKRMPESRKMNTRNTAQQQVIRGIFHLAGRPLTASEAHALAQQERPNIGIATVYRAIRRMQDEGALRTVLIPGEGTFYEMAGPAHHHYFFCRICCKAYVIGICPEAVRKMTPPGFFHERHDIVLHGQCRGCRLESA